MMAVPSSSRCRSSTVELPVMLKITCRPRESTPTMRQVTISLMISPESQGHDGQIVARSGAGPDADRSPRWQRR